MVARRLRIAGGDVPLTDVVAGLAITQGRSDPQSQAAPPEMTFTLRGQHNIPGGTSVRFDVGTSLRFLGYVAETEVDRLAQQTSVVCSSIVARLAHIPLGNTFGGTWPAETLNNRMTRIFNLFKNHKITLFTPTHATYRVVAENVAGRELLEFAQWHASGIGYALDIAPDGVCGITRRVFDHAGGIVVDVPASAITAARYLDTERWRVRGMIITNSADAKLEYGTSITHELETPYENSNGAFLDVLTQVAQRWEPPTSTPGAWPVPNPETYNWVPEITVRADANGLEDSLCMLRSSSSCVSIPMSYPNGTATQRWVVEGWREVYSEQYSVWGLNLSPTDRYNEPTPTQRDAIMAGVV